MRTPRFLCAVLACILGFAPMLSSAAQPRPVRPEDILKLALVSQPAISPSGQLVAFTVARMNGPRNRYDTNLWIVPVAGGAPQAITHDGRSGGDEAWSSKNVLAFVRAVGNVPQIFSYDPVTNEMRELTHAPGGATGPVWSHDGTRIAYVAVSNDPPAPAQVDFVAAGFTPPPTERESDIRQIDVERYQIMGLGYTYNRRSDIWTMRADGANATKLATGNRWSGNAFAWSPDDTHIAFVHADDSAPKTGVSAIYTISSRGGVEQRVASTNDSNTQPFYLHTGNGVYFFSGDARDISSYPALVSMTPGTSAPHAIVPANTYQWGDLVLADLKMPGAICGPLATPDDRSLITEISTPGGTTLIAIDRGSGTITKLTAGDGEVADCTMSANGERIAYTCADFTHPAEVCVLDRATGRSRKLTELNATYLSRVLLSTPEPFWITDAAGYKVQAWFMPAVGPKATGKRPTLLDIHGGPQTEFGATFFHELQYWTGQGYNVVFVNPQGSVGYGYAFEHALVGNWGPPMFDDVMRAMDAVAQRPSVDPERFGVIGGSYGGYATLWVISHTDRFKAAISERPASDLATQSLDSFFAGSNSLGGEYAWGKPWDATSKNYADSPLNFVENVHTPVLLLHSQFDTETPIDQTLDEFSALKQLGRVARFVEVPNETHDLNRVGSPIHRIERLHIFTDWFGHYLRP
jgi:dipeptidyl aminopeptidase/acylaminoacyl peptidase